MTSPRANTNTLYRFYSSTGQLLYIGITMNPPARFKSHEGSKDWWSTVSGITVESYGDRTMLAAAERRAIQVEKPKYNIVHNRPAAKSIITTRPTTAATNVIRHTCGACRKIVLPKTGYVHIDTRIVHEVERVTKEFWKKQDARGPWAAVSMSDLMDLPEDAQWMTHHASCDPIPECSGYWFAVERIQTYEQMLSWTAHLMDKDWLKYTNWSEYIYSKITPQTADC